MKVETENQANLDDIIFQDRNKAYGAYSLRSEYHLRVKKAVSLGVSLFGIALLTPLLWAKVKGEEEKVYIYATPLPQFSPPPEKVKPIEPELPKPSEPAPQVATIRVLPPEIVPDDQETEVMMTQDEIEKADVAISNVTQEGIDGELPPVDIDEASKGTGAVEPPVAIATPEETDVFTTVELMPAFNGGMDALAKYLSKNLRYPRGAADAGVQGKVYVSFVVGRDGEISKIELLKGIGFGCDEEARRVIKGMPKWIPGKQSGRAVMCKFTLPIAFTLSE
jgi:protein TonB